MYPGPGDSEFAFELLVCRWAELSWHPVDGRRPAVVARQLGTRERRWDTVILEVDPQAFAARRRFGDRGLDRDLLRVVRGAPPEYEWYRDALDDPGFPWRYVREAVHRAAGRDLLDERAGANGRVEFRRRREYPDWVERLIAIENKPDLDASAAGALARQIEHDVDAGLADEVWVATAATGGRVSPALLENLPVEAGVVEFDFSEGARESAAEVVWHPSRLATDADPDRRLELAERAYGAGWRGFRETMRPDCRAFSLRRAGRALLAHCEAKGCHQTAAECSSGCPEFAPEPPAWRTRGWPIEGGPGKGVDALLDRRRERERRAAVEAESDSGSEPGRFAADRG